MIEANYIDESLPQNKIAGDSILIGARFAFESNRQSCFGEGEVKDK